MYYDIIVLGILVSLIYAELTGYTPAGLVSAGYLVMHLRSPERIAATLAAAFLTLGIYKLLSRVVILYGRRSFGAMIVISFALSWAAGAAGFLAAAPRMIGTLITGIIARDLERQGIAESLVSLGIVIAVLAVLLMLVGHPVLRPHGGV